MNGQSSIYDSEPGVMSGPCVSPCPDRSLDPLRRVWARARNTDLDLLRLSCLCRANALLQGQAQRSRTLARIHRLFDHAPSDASLDELLLSALLESVGGGGKEAPVPCSRDQRAETDS